MLVSWVWVPICLVIGTTIGFFMLALLQAARKGDGDE